MLVRSPDNATNVICEDRAGRYTKVVIVKIVNTFFQRAFRKLAPKLATRIFKILDSLVASKTISSQLCVTKLGNERTKIIPVILKWDNFGK